MLTTEAFNVLPKTLEEPPRSLFILATTEPHKLPPTIQLRRQHFAFRLLEYGEIRDRLAGQREGGENHRPKKDRIIDPRPGGGGEHARRAVLLDQSSRVRRPPGRESGCARCSAWCRLSS